LNSRVWPFGVTWRQITWTFDTP